MILKGMMSTRKNWVHGATRLHGHGDTPMVSVNFYPGKGKLMAQPGARNPERLDEWLSQYGIWKNQLPVATDDITHHDDEFVMFISTAPPQSPESITTAPSAPSHPLHMMGILCSINNLHWMDTSVKNILMIGILPHK
jgi:hypothetical protein